VALSHRSRDLLLILLALTTGATDATAFERLGHVFASVITGNLVLLGVSAANGATQLALFSGCALLGYAIGVILAAPRRGEQPKQEPGWPTGATLALALDLALLGVFAVGWELAGDHPGRAAQRILLGLAAAAMGAQSTAVRRVGPFSTTYLTSTLTGLLEAVRVRRWPEGHVRSIGILLMALVGAATATVLIAHARALLPLVQLAPLVIVILASRRLSPVEAP
jgi:uncharacterized membrane protein YoaK (UPF0700 family)